MTEVQRLIGLIRTELRLEAELDAATPLLSSGLVDSLSVVVLLDALEDEYGVVIDENAIAVETFDTPEQILAYVETSRRPST